jgi:hypothetical protein
MSSSGFNPLALVAPELYAQQIAIQQRQGLGNALLQQGTGEPGKGGYGGLRSAGNAILGAMLAKRANQDMANLYAPQQQSQPTWGQPNESQISNNPGSGPMMAHGQTPQPNQQLQPQAQNPMAGQPIDPQSQQVLQQRYGSSEPQQWQSQPQGQRTIPGAMGQMIPDLPGLSHEASMLAYSQSPQTYFTALAAAKGPTPEMKNAAFANPNDPGAQQQAIGGIIGKSGSIEVRPEGFIRLPNGQIVYGPNESSNVYYTTGPNNEPIAHMIQGGAEAAAGTAGQIEAAKEQNRVIEVTLSDGRVIPMRAGDVVPYGSKQPVSPPPTAPANKQAGNPSQQSPPIPGLNLRLPQIGQSVAQAEINKAAGAAAANSGHVQATSDALLKAIDGMIAINNNVPDGTVLPPNWKAEINQVAPNLPGFRGDAGALAQWQQLNSIGILGGIKNLGLGRVDIPIVKQIQAGGGIPAEVPAADRLRMLQTLKTEVINNRAAAQNTAANLNSPNAANPPRTPTQSYPAINNPSAQEIVDELRRRGKVK